MKMSRFPADMTTEQMNRLRNRIDTSTLICMIIDEISYVSPNLLAQVDNRLRQLMACPEMPFGGIAIILMGDFYQLPPVNAQNLFCSTWNLFGLRKELSSDGESNPITRGTIEFSKFKKFELIQQMRAAEDIPHTEMLNQMRNPIQGVPRINRNYIEDIKVLEKNDFENEPEFLSTPIVVTSNKERHLITKIRSQHRAKMKKTPRIIWKYPLLGRLATNVAAPIHEYLYKKKQPLNGCFVAGVPGYITENINPQLKISNGSPITFHSLTLDPRENYNEVMKKIEESNGIEDIKLKYAPTHIHVKLTLGNPNKFIGRTLIENEAVIPIPISEKITSHTVNFPGSQEKLEVKVKTHSIEMGFAIPVHKVQGQTCDRLIIDLNPRPFIPKINFHGLYVALSRVKLGRNLRILQLHQTTRDLSYLLKLEPSKFLNEWLAGFNNNGCWTAETSKKKLQTTNRQIILVNRKINNEKSSKGVETNENNTFKN